MLRKYVLILGIGAFTAIFVGLLDYGFTQVVSYVVNK